MGLKKLIKRIGKAGMLGLYWVFRKRPIKRDYVFFESNLGRNYADSPRYIYEEMARRVAEGGEKYTFVWSFAGKPEEVKRFPGVDVKTVNRKSMAYFYALARAEVWVSNCRMPEYLKKRKYQRYIQTWHGTPLKKLALDMTDVHMAGEKSIEAYKESFRHNASTWDCLVSQNPFSSFTFRRCFDFHSQMIESGYPRNDILFSKNNSRDIAEIKRKYGIAAGQKCILYAPTFRDDEANGSDSYSFSRALDFDMLVNELCYEGKNGESYVILVKYHYLVKDKVDFSQYRGKVIEFNERADISELYLISDMMITDYSSVMFDYSILKRPIFFFCYDYDKYKQSLRGFYFDFLRTAPGPIVKTTAQLISAIQDYDPSMWTEKYERFNSYYNCFDDGHASRKVADYITEGRITELKRKGYKLYGALYRLFKLLPMGGKRAYFIMTHDDSPEGNCGVMLQQFINAGGTMKGSSGLEYAKKYDLKRVSSLTVGNERRIHYRCSILTRKDTAPEGKAGYIRFILGSAWALSRSKYIFMDNGFLPLAYLKLRRRSRLVQLWHGTGSIKRFGQDANKGELALLEKRANRNITMMTVSSDETRELYAGCFGIDVSKVKVTGLPRTDCFFERTFAAGARDRLEEDYPQIKGKKLVLYVPTFRDDTLENEQLPFDINLLMNQLPENMVIGMRLHPFLSEAIRKRNASGKQPTVSEAMTADNLLIDFTGYKGINTLLGAADVLVTDYSSVIYEYCILDRPMIFYAYDLEKFKDRGRGFYCDYEDYVPGTVVRDTKELAVCLYTELFGDEKRRQFFEKSYAFRDGQSAKRVYEEVTKK